MGTQLGTTDNTTNQDGTSSWSGKFMQTTNKGEMIVVTGSGTGETPNSKGIVKIRGEGDMWTQSARLAVVLPYIGDNIAYRTWVILLSGSVFI